MAEPEGKLTETQLEIMTVVWAAGPDGIKAAEIWQQLAETRDVARTTVLTMVRRLEDRGWLRRQSEAPVVRYVAAVSQVQANGRLAARFLDEFFEGSASQLVSSLLGSRRLKKREVERLRQILDEEAR